MAGWFEAFANLAGGLGQGLDRYTTLRRLDEDNMFKRRMQEAALAQNAERIKQQGDYQAKQLQLLDQSILNHKANRLTSMYGPGDEVADSDLAAFDEAGLGGRIKRGDHVQAPIATGRRMELPGEALLLNDYDDEQGVTYQATDPAFIGGGYRLPEDPVLRNQFAGTRDQQIEQFKLGAPQRQQQLLLEALQSGDPRDPQFNALMTTLTNGQYDVRNVIPPTQQGRQPTQLEMLMNPETRDAAIAALKAGAQATHIPKPGDDGQMSPYAESNIINRLTTQWSNATKPARELERQASIMRTGLEAIMRDPKAVPAASQAILTTFQKILDPTSVVRTEEYLRSSQNQALESRARGAYERLLGPGGAGVPVEDLKIYAKMADDLVKAQIGPYIGATKLRIGKTAKHYKIPDELIFDDYDVTTGVQSANEVTMLFPGETQPRSIPISAIADMLAAGGKIVR